MTLSGALTVANALNESISVSVATKYGNKENAYTISGRSHGPSFLVNISEVKQLQFKFSNFPDNKLPWSNPVELGELRKSKNHAVAVSLSCKYFSNSNVKVFLEYFCLSMMIF